METSVFYTIKRMLGMDPANCMFDTAVLVHINSALSELCQLGVGPEEGFIVDGVTQTWTDLFGESNYTIEMAKTFVYLKVRLLFDPPNNSFLVDNLQKSADEIAWRLTVVVDERRIRDELLQSGACAPRNQGYEVGCPKNSRAART